MDEKIIRIFAKIHEKSAILSEKNLLFKENLHFLYQRNILKFLLTFYHIVSITSIVIQVELTTGYIYKSHVLGEQNQ